MKIPLFGFAIMLMATGLATAQTVSVPNQKLPVYGEIGLGIGQTLLRGDTKSRLQEALGGSGFGTGIGNNVSMGFYVAPENWRGLGIGSRIRGTFGTPTNGDGGNQYIFNYYNLALSAKYYPGGQFNKGLYGRGSVGFGQFTAKRLLESGNQYMHQYAIGSSVMLGAGYTFRGRRSGLSIEGEWELSSRNGTVNGIGEVAFRSGQLGLNLILSY